MRYSQIRAFHAVAIHGGFSAAAAALGQTQPALSDQVRRLEQAHDVLLFRRDGRRVRLTERGEALLALTRHFFAAEDGIAAFMQTAGAAVEGELRIVADAVQHITPALTRFRAAHPKVKVALRSGNTETVLARLRAYEAEIGVVGQLDPGSDLEVVDLGTSPIIAVVAIDGPLSGLDSVSFADLTTLPLVMRETGSRTRASLEAEADLRRIAPKAAIEVEGREAMREVVAAGAGVGLVSEAEVGNDARLKRVAIADATLTMPEAVVFLKTRRDVPVIRAFRSALIPSSGGT